jgi:threonine dehydrogenase-like Zn-dependent dehydrogenase
MVGKRVTSEINLACGACERCAAGLGRHCASRTVLGILGKDGCFAEHVTLPVENLHVVPDGLSDEAAVFTEPLAAAYEIVEQLTFPRGTEVLVLGDGKLGLLVTFALAAEGLAVTLCGHHPEKMALVSQVAETLDAPPDRLYPVVVEATGSPAGLEAALGRVVPRGTIVLKSTFHGAVELETAKLVIDELTLVGSRCGPFEPALRAIASGAIDPTPLLTRTYPVSEGAEALEAAQARDALKILLKP